MECVRVPARGYKWASNVHQMAIKWPLNGVCVRVAPHGFEITIK